jgi:inorganic pyrophosphatase
MNLIDDIEVGVNSPNEVNVVVENCKESSNKIEYDEKKNVFRLDRILYSAVYWPFEYGFIPQTKAGDGDPLDICVMISKPTFPGCIIKARPVGLLEMEDEKGPDNKILAVAVRDPAFDSDEAISNVSQLQSHDLREIKEFFETYKKLEPGKWVKFGEIRDSSEARRIVLGAMANYQKSKANGSEE